MLSRTLLVLLVVYFISDFSHVRRDNKFFRKDYSYIEAVESHYKIHLTPHTLADAKQICILEGASLFYPENDEEANAVIAYLNEVHSTTGWPVYLGLTDLKKEGEFETIDEKPISDVYKKWKQGEPNNNGPDGEDCVIMYRSGYMNDVICNKARFICKKKNYSYIKAVDSYYKIHKTPRTFADAKRMCVLEGASLFYPENDDEVHAVIEYWNNTHPTNDWLFVGISDLMTEGIFETIDGKLIYDVYDQWLNGEPNDQSYSEDCVQLNQQGYIKDISCNTKSQFICKSDLPFQWNYNCNMTNLDYIFNEDIGKCYKLHTTALTWTEAYAVCRAEESYLAVINNISEANYLASLTKSVAKRRIGGTYQSGIYHLGFHNRLNDGWQTVTGKRLIDATGWWGDYLPTAEDENKCGSMFYSGLLNNIDCDTKSFFICEHEVSL